MINYVYLFETVMACLHEAIVAAIGRATDRRDRRPIAATIASCKHAIMSN